MPLRRQRFTLRDFSRDRRYFVASFRLFALRYFTKFSVLLMLNLPCQVSSDVEMENATYNGWLHSHFISSVIVFSSKGLCLLYHARWWMLTV